MASMRRDGSPCSAPARWARRCCRDAAQRHAPPATSWSPPAGPSGRRRCGSATASRSSAPPRRRRRRHPDPHGQAAGHGRPARRARAALPADRLVVSAAAGITTSFIEEPARRRHPGRAGHVEHPRARRRGDERHLRRRARGRGAPGAHRGDLLAGRATIRVPESQQDAVTALSGSGPAYFFYLVEAMTDAGILLGLPRQVAHDLIVQTAIGSAVMLRDSGERPVDSCARRSPPRPARRSTPSASSRTTGYGPRCSSALEAARDRGRELAAGGEDKQ